MRLKYPGVLTKDRNSNIRSIVKIFIGGVIMIVINKKLKWKSIYFSSGELKYEGFTTSSAKNKDLIPCGQGVNYFENGNKHMEGSFGEDWFIETGTEYYENGNVKFIGEYNKGPRTYYGPRYFVFGRLFNEAGNLWYEGTFHFRRGGVGYPIFEKEKSFVSGTEFNVDGSIKKVYIEDNSIEINSTKIEIEIKTSEEQINNDEPQELSQEVLEKIDKINKEAIENMTKHGYSKEDAEDLVNYFNGI